MSSQRLSAALLTLVPAASPSPAPAAPLASTGELSRTGVGTGLLGAGGVAIGSCAIVLRARLADGGRRA